MKNKIENIMNAASLKELLDEISAFCKESYMSEEDLECIQLVEMVKSKEDSDIHVLLCSYLSVCDDSDEVIEALYEFVSNCQGYIEADEEMTQQVTKEEFETILTECEEKVGIVSCIEKEHKYKIIEIPMLDLYRNPLYINDKEIVIALPRIYKSIDKKDYIAESLGKLVYDILKDLFTPDILRSELFKYIPRTREIGGGVKSHFEQCFKSVVNYKERKPGIYPEFDEHMQQVLDMEFYKRIIKRYLNSTKGYIYAYSEKNFKKLEFNTKEYGYSNSDGLFTGTLMCKKWGKRSNIIAFVDMDNGNKIVFATYKHPDNYLGLEKIDIGERIKVEFGQSYDDRMKVVSISRTK